MAARKLNFFMLTLGVSFVVVSLMAAAASGGSSAPASREGNIWTELPPAQASHGKDDVPGRSDRITVAVPSFADIVEQVNPAVVNITATEIIRSGQKRDDGGRFEFFFPNPHGRDQNDPEREDHGGSGFIISEDGYILTNYHVIEDADRVNVQLLGDSREYNAEIVGTDPDTDLALVKITADHPLPVIPLGESDALRVGDWVLAIGNPLAYEHTVTVGVVSAKGRKLWAMNRDSSLDNFIQTDAAINRGNSGGPLLNVHGEAIGINSAISVAGQGISFAIPIDMAKQVVSQLMSSGKVERGYLGVEIHDIAEDLDPEKREVFGLQGEKGAFVERVTEGLPAARAGVKKGDAIVSVEGKPLKSSDDLIRTISALAPGSTVRLGVIRNGEKMTLTAKLADRAELARLSRPTAVPEPAPEKEKSDEMVAQNLGFVVHEIGPTLQEQYRLDDDTQGVVIVHVDQTSQAWEKGLKPGDVIVEINKVKITDLDSFDKIVHGAKAGDLLSLYVEGPTASRFVALRVPEK
ncbi:MAG TPA: Do family serine endopeptidase [Candidatus Saccharimonadales bacterium]|nr:Do family serine endopeptidase [Candidatus Saccharimonadales bacterium]